MKNVLVLLSSNRPIQDRTRNCIGRLTALGAAYLTQQGTADVALARNIALTSACEALRALNDGLLRSLKEKHAESGDGYEETYRANRRDVVLMVDDDMEFTPEQVAELVEHARRTGTPASAMYATTMGTLAATRMKWEPELGTRGARGWEQRWMVGLGLLAIPAARLHELELASAPFDCQEKQRRAFTSCQMFKGVWFSEDYMLCYRLGGVDLLPIAVGHLKTIPIYPDDVTVAKIRNGEQLDGEADPSQLEGLKENLGGAL